MAKESSGMFRKLANLFFPCNCECLSAEPEPSLIQKEFVGEMKNTYTCVTCGSKYPAKQNFYDLNLHFPACGESKYEENSRPNKLQEPHFTLKDLFDEYFRAEKLQGEGQFYCKSCDSLQDAEKTVDLTKFPNVLILSIARFSYNMETQSKSKIQHLMRFPKILMVNDHEACEGGNQSHLKYGDMYGLTGVIVHKGASVHLGHYYCFGRHNKPVTLQTRTSSDVFEDDWYVCNDSHVSYTGNFSAVEESSCDSAYILFYTKVNKL